MLTNGSADMTMPGAAHITEMRLNRDS